MTIPLPCPLKPFGRQSPTRTQTGFLQKVCFDATTHVAVRATRCFYMHVGKCRYCAQEGDSLKSLAESYFTGVCAFAPSQHLDETFPAPLDNYARPARSARPPARLARPLGLTGKSGVALECDPCSLSPYMRVGSSQRAARGASRLRGRGWQWTSGGSATECEA